VTAYLTTIDLFHDAYEHTANEQGHAHHPIIVVFGRKTFVVVIVVRKYGHRKFNIFFVASTLGEGILQGHGCS